MDAIFTDPTDLELFRVALMLIVFNILLPSFDIYSDLAFSYSLLSGTYEPLYGKAVKHPTFGSI